MTSPPEPLASWRTLVRSFGALATGEAIARVFGLLTLLVLTRELGPGGFGLVTIGTSLVICFSLVVDAGTEVLNLRDMARDPGRFRELAGPVLGLRLALSVLSAALLAATVALAVPARDRPTLLLFALLLPVVALNLRWMVLAIQASWAIAAGNVGSQLVFLAGVVALVHDRGDSALVPALMAAGELGYAVTVLVAARRRCGAIRPVVDRRAWARNLRDGFPLMLNQFARTTVGFFGLFAIAVGLGHADAGVYAAAYKPILFFAVVTSMLFNSFLASYSAAHTAAALDLLRRTLRLALAATIPIALLLTAAGRPLLTIGFGDAYAGGAPVLAVLSWTLVLTAVGGGYAMVLVAAHHQRTLMQHNVVAAIFNVAATIAGIAVAGITGAAAGALATSALVTALNYRACRRLGLAPSLAALLRPPDAAIGEPRAAEQAAVRGG